MIPQVVAKYTSSLSTGISKTSTSMTLSSTITRKGETVPTGFYGFVIDRGQENEEVCTGTYNEGVVTFVLRGLSDLDGSTSVEDNKFAHDKGAIVEITAHPALSVMLKTFDTFIDTYQGHWEGAVANYAALLGFDGGPGIAHWNFDGNANDVSGNGYNGTVVGATLTTDRNGNPDSAYYFDGTETNYIEIGTVALNPFVGSSVHASVSFWMYGEAGGVSQQVIISLGSTARWAVFRTNTGRIYLLTRNSTNTGYNKYYSNTIISNGEWHHISVVVDGTDLTFYMDGVAEATQTIDYYNNERNDYIIASGDSPSTYLRQFKGKLDDIRVHAVALTASQVSNIYKGLPNDGEVRVTLDDSKIYVYDLDTTTWTLAGAGGGAGTVYRTTLLGTEAEGDDNKTFQLTTGSFPDKKYFQVYKNGVLMVEGATNDYIATGSNQAVFNDAVEDDDVIDLLVVSIDLYNPAWGNVNADILPDTDNQYDIGSTAKKFKDAHFSGAVSAGSFSGDGSNLDDGANGKLTSGTAANELVRLDGSGKLPPVDGSQLTNLPPQSNFQILGKLTKGSVTMHNITTAADTDGTLFLAYNAPATANNTIIIFRLAKDSVTGNYKMTHSFQSAISGNSYWATPSMTVMGDYLYYSRSNSNNIYRVDKATLTNEATISYSGDSPDSSVKYLFNDGTNLYVYNRTGSYYIKKYSVSGTTFTFISQITSSAAGGSTGGTWLDATNFYVALQNGTIYIINRTTGTVSNSSDTPPKVEILAAATKTDQRVGTRMLSITSNNTASSDNYAIIYLDWYSSTNF